MPDIQVFILNCCSSSGIGQAFTAYELKKMDSFDSRLNMVYLVYEISIPNWLELVLKS
jgi:hypothetical protein